MARHPYEPRVFSVKVSFVREKCESQAPPREGAAWNPGICGGVPSVDERTGIFCRCARQTASDRAFSLPVDTGGQVDNVCALSEACQEPSAGGQEALEDLPRQDRPARDESGEVADRVRPLVQQLPGLLGLVPAAGGDDLQLGAEGAPRAAHVFQGRGKDVGAREAAGALREAGILDPAGVAVFYY